MWGVYRRVVLRVIMLSGYVTWRVVIVIGIRQVRRVVRARRWCGSILFGLLLFFGMSGCRSNRLSQE